MYCDVDEFVSTFRMTTSVFDQRSLLTPVLVSVAWVMSNEYEWLTLGTGC